MNIYVCVYMYINIYIYISASMWKIGRVKWNTHFFEVEVIKLLDLTIYSTKVMKA